MVQRPSQDLFTEDRELDPSMEEEATPIGSQAEAKRRKERLEKEEFIKKKTVRIVVPWALKCGLFDAVSVLVCVFGVG